MTNQEDLIPVEGEPNLFRDRNAGAIINMDTSSYAQYKKNETTKADRTRKNLIHLKRILKKSNLY